MVTLDRITRIYRFSIEKDQWERPGGNDHFIAYKLYGSTVHQSGNSQMTFKKDMLMIANCNDSYTVTHNENERTALGGCIAVHFTTAAPFPLHLTMLDCTACPQIKNAFFKILDAWERFRLSGSPADECECTAHFYMILSLAYKLMHKSTGTGIEEAKRFLDRNYMNSTLSVTDAAAHIGLSARRMNELFFASYGQTPARYLNALRLSAALALLDRENIKISDIAPLCGYSCANYFIRAFKKEFGVAPGVFRKGGGRKMYAAGNGCPDPTNG